jgi:DNA mismatch repair ATPase MutL
LNHCLADRKDNQVYRLWSLGEKGEALHSLSICSELTIITKNSHFEHGLHISFNEDDFTPNIAYIEKPLKGTMVSVRNIHKNTSSIQATYKKYREN